MASEPAPAKKKRVSRPKTVYQLRDGTQVSYKGVPKFFRDVIRNHNGVRAFEKVEVVIVPDANRPLGDKTLIPSRDNPICLACGLDTQGGKSPYLDYAGAENPVATILVESISKKEDDYGVIGAGGAAAWMSGVIVRLMKLHNVSLDEIRWVPITRCAARDGKLPNWRTKGNWCRHYAIQDLIEHPPKVVIPVGTAVLGLLSHKSNAQDWTGRLLTWRGWPDDWLTDPDYVYDRPDPLDETKFTQGHPLFGPVPDVRIPMVPLQNPRLILALQNEVLRQDWERQLTYALQIGKKHVAPPRYTRPWYHITTDVEEIKDILTKAIWFAENFDDFILSYDTETTGLKQWPYFRRLRADKIIRSDENGKRPRIVFMMFRWKNPETGQPESIGFPWDYPESDLVTFLEELAPYVIRLLSTAKVVGHNLTFDDLFTIATVGRKDREYEPFNDDGSWNEAYLQLHERINMIAEASSFDTWHMAFTALQKRGSLGLEILAYDYVPDLAGYEEDMTLLITLRGDEMDPANNKGGHYAMCPKHLWKSHLEPYVMGDVEVTYQARDALAARLERTKPFKIPLCHPEHRGVFRYYQTPNRAWVYQNVMVRANQTLIKMMARGMYINPEELEAQEQDYPEKVEDAKKKLRAVDADIESWCVQKKQEAEAKVDEKTGEHLTWELDLENKTLLKELLFDVLKCPILRFTKKGRQLYGEEPEDWSHLTYDQKKEFAAVDKFTLNRLAVDHPNLRPLQEYRKVFKLYSTYVRPMRNMMADHLDKKQRQKEPHLSIDHCIHASFMLTGTRGGRLSCRDPNLQQLPNEGLVKKLFTSRFGERGCIYASDLSQIELRLMAAACGDESMVSVYLKGDDIHSMTASKVFKKPYEHFTKKYMEMLQHEGKNSEAKDLELKRKIAKTVNFLTGYGGGAFGLQNVLANNEVYLSIEECEHIIESFFAAYPMLKRFLGIYKTFIEEHAVAVSMFGRVRQFDEIYSEDNEARSKALRAGCNHLIQSTASDMMLICLFTIENLMRDAGLKSLLVSTVHDSLVIDALREELPQVHKIVNWVVNNIPTVVETTMPDYDTSWMHIVPFAGDSEVGLNYLETNKISGENPDWAELLKPVVKDKK